MEVVRKSPDCVGNDSARVTRCEVVHNRGCIRSPSHPPHDATCLTSPTGLQTTVTGKSERCSPMRWKPTIYAGDHSRYFVVLTWEHPLSWMQQNHAGDPSLQHWR
ncbi:hypothetical protein CsSME_00024145 [Camellia sinensis var. sinensis]